jgi:restriction endonuclease S subunit
LEIEFFNGHEIIDYIQYGTSKELNEEARGFPTLRLNEFDSFFIRPPQKYCDKIDDPTFQSLALKKGDVLICRTNGNPKLVGKSAIVAEDSQYAFASYLFRVRPKKDLLLPTTLVTYLNSRFGRAEVEKHLMVSNQANFSPARFREIQIPRFDQELQFNIETVIWQSFDNISKSKQIYTEAESLILSELGLFDWQPSRQLSYVKSFSDSWQSGRMDAEYFQPRYDEIVAAIQDCSDGWDSLGNLATINKCVEVGSEEYLDEGVPFVRVSNLSPFEITEEKYISESLYTEIRQHQPEQGEILLSKDATPGIAHYLRDRPQRMVPSGGILRLKSKTDRVDNEYLTLVLNSLLTQEQVNRGVGGSVILHWRPGQVKETLIPILSEETQSQIREKVAESFSLRQQSKELLERAKQAVEMAIEQDEETAIDWLESENSRRGDHA